MEVMEQETAEWKRNVVYKHDDPYYEQELRMTALFEEIEREVIEKFRERERRGGLMRKPAVEDGGGEGEGEEKRMRS